MATKEELKARADELGLNVTRGDGQEGEPLVEDYERAIANAEEALPDALTAEGGEKASFTVGGPYKVFGKRRGETIDGEVVEGDDGARIIRVGDEWALLDPLLESGFLKTS